ncbi:MAG: M28 family metallopeptidase [Flavobacteriaceae bacterium]
MKKITLLLVLISILGCQQTKKQTVEKAKPQKTKGLIDVAETKRILFTLAADSMKGRDSDSKGYFKAAEFVRSYFQSNNISPFYPDYQDSFSTKGVKSYNVVGQIGSYDPAKKTILIGAHLDHVGIQGEESDSIFNGANDNASGSTAVMQIGKYLAQENWEYNIILALFADEEKGLQGAYHLAQRFKDENIKPAYMVNFEMIGKTLTTGENQVYMTGYNYSNMPKVMNNISPNFVQYLPEAKQYSLFKRSDNYAFYQTLNTPAFTLSSFDFKNFDYYHKAGDEAERMDIENMHQIIRTAAMTIAQMMRQQDEIHLSMESQEFLQQ